MSNNSWWAFAAGATGALLLGYCIYYDRKRRNDPNYKRKVHERRQKDAPAPAWVENRAQISNELRELNDHEFVQQYFQNQIKLGEDLFRLGRLDEGLVHLANAIMLCAQPVALLETMKAALPEPIYTMLMTKLPELQNPRPVPSASTVSVDLDLD